MADVISCGTWRNTQGPVHYTVTKRGLFCILAHEWPVNTARSRTGRDINTHHSLLVKTAVSVGLTIRNKAGSYGPLPNAATRGRSHVGTYGVGSSGSKDVCTAARLSQSRDRGAVLRLYDTRACNPETRCTSIAPMPEAFHCGATGSAKHIGNGERGKKLLSPASASSAAVSALVRVPLRVYCRLRLECDCLARLVGWHGLGLAKKFVAAWSEV